MWRFLYLKLLICQQLKISYYILNFCDNTLLKYIIINLYDEFRQFEIRCPDIIGNYIDIILKYLIRFQWKFLSILIIIQYSHYIQSIILNNNRYEIPSKYNTWHIVYFENLPDRKRSQNNNTRFFFQKKCGFICGAASKISSNF